MGSRWRSTLSKIEVNNHLGSALWAKKRFTSIGNTPKPATISHYLQLESVFITQFYHLCVYLFKYSYVTLNSFFFFFLELVVGITLPPIKIPTYVPGIVHIGNPNHLRPSFWWWLKILPKRKKWKVVVSYFIVHSVNFYFWIQN